MKTIIIVAMTADRVIGMAGRLPWHLPADLKHFKATTLGHAVIMGRKTFASIAKPLPGRRNIVITRDPAHVTAIVSANAKSPPPETSLDPVASLDEAFDLCRRRREINAFVVGGAQIYAQALPRVDEMIITHVDLTNITGDTFFPAWDPADWIETQSTDIGDGHRVARYRRNSST